MSQNRKVMIAAVALLSTITMCVALMVIFNHFIHVRGIEEAADRSSGEEVLLVNEPHLIEIGEGVGEIHKEFNTLLGWKRYKHLNAKDAKVLKTQAEPLKDLLNKAEDQSLKADLENALHHLGNANSKEDIQEFLTAHRIMHDLDHYINGASNDGKVWGYTHIGFGEHAPTLAFKNRD